MNRPTKPLGNLGEKLALEHLKSQGYRLLTRNINLRFAEADLVVEKKGTIVLVEVKTTIGHAFLYPQELVHARKKSKLRRLAGYLSQEYPGKTIRIDVIAIEMNNETPTVTHIENAVEGS